MKVFSEEWAVALKNAINSNKNYKASASWWEGDFIFVVKPAGPLKEEVRVFVGLLHGDCTGARVLKPGENVKAEYTYSGDYESWVKVLKQQLDPIRGLLSGSFKLVGDMAKVLRATKAAQELVVSTTLIKGQEFL